MSKALLSFFVVIFCIFTTAVSAQLLPPSPGKPADAAHLLESEEADDDEPNLGGRAIGGFLSGLARSKTAQKIILNRKLVLLTRLIEIWPHR